ncbi:hypothetical protein BDF14DRAFT_1748767 [Spinellus fusiger]|nr:hypothetical protein BDF14DRAFT_1748767 [Spinellus fusiger]
MSLSLNIKALHTISRRSLFLCYLPFLYSICAQPLIFFFCTVFTLPPTNTTCIKGSFALKKTMTSAISFSVSVPISVSTLVVPSS